MKVCTVLCLSVNVVAGAPEQHRHRQLLFTLLQDVRCKNKMPEWGMVAVLYPKPAVFTLFGFVITRILNQQIQAFKCLFTAQL